MRSQDASERRCSFPLANLFLRWDNAVESQWSKTPSPGHLVVTFSDLLVRAATESVKNLKISIWD